MQLKTVEVDGATYAEVKDGHPVYLKEDGSEVTPDVTSAPKKISALNKEAQSHRERAEALAKQLSAFEGLDPDEARTAMERVRSFDDGELVNSGKLDEVKERTQKAVEARYQSDMKKLQAQLDELTGIRDGLTKELHTEKLTNAFANSQYIKDKVGVPVDMVRAAFGGNFSIEDGQIVAKMNGEVIPSRTNIGDPASFEEAIEAMIEAYPGREYILKGHNGGGTGQRGGNASGKKVVSKDEFYSLDPATRMAKMKEGYQVV